MNRFLNPYPLESQFEGQPPLSIGARISTASGWLDLNASPYRLEATSFAERSVGWRKREITSDYVEGTYLVSAVRENVVESLAIWVREENHYDLARARTRLEDALCQPTYQLMFRTSEVTRYWECTVADYTVATQREFIHAGIALIKAQVPRHPLEEIVATSLDDM